MLSKFSVKKPYTVFVAIILILILGVVSFTKMSTDLLPKMDFPYAIVITTYPGASPEEVEATVTTSLESSMATVSNIKNISSISADNMSMVICEFEQTANMDSITIEMRENIDQITAYWDDSISDPIIMKINPDMMPIMMAAADVDNLTDVEISEYAEDELIPEIESIEGVASVTAVGSIEESINVVIQQDKIDALNEKITAALDDSFADAQSEINSAKSEITSGESTLNSSKTSSANEIGSAQTSLLNKKLELISTQEELEAQLAEVQTQSSELETQITTLTEMNEQVSGLQSALAMATAANDTTTATQLQAQLSAIETGIREQLSDDTFTLDMLPSMLEQLNATQAQLTGAISVLESSLSQIESGKTSLDDALSSLTANEILASIEMGSASAQLASGKSQLEEAQTTLDESKDSAYDSADANSIITIDTIEQILTAQNFSMPAGYITEDNVSYLVRVGDKVEDEENLEDLVLMDLGLDGIDPIKLSDVADVAVVNNSDEVYAKINGNPGVILSIVKQTGYSTGDVSDKINEKFEELTDENQDLHLTTLMDQGIYIDYIVNSVLNNMISGGLLAILILLFFLKDLKPTIVIAFSIPVSIVFAIVLMYFSGITLNVISLSGLALGVGMLVDNSIVVIENIYRLRNEGYSPKQAAITGAKQVSGAIAASTLTTICVFAPIIFTEGITRQLFVDMGLTIAYSLIASLFIALTLVPAMGAGLLKKTKEKSHPILERIQNGYGKFLSKALRFKALVFLASIGLLVLSVFAAFSNGMAFMPDMESTQATITITPPEDAQFSDATALSDEVIERISDIDDIETVGAMVGSATMMGMSTGSDDTTISMYLILSEDKELSNSQLKDAILERTSDLNCEIDVQTEAMDMSAMTGSGISVEIKGRDLEKLQTIASDIAALIENVEGTTEVSDGMEETTPVIEINVDKEKAASYGMTVAQIYSVVYTEVAESSSATTIETDIKDYSVYVSSSNQEEMTLDGLKNLTFSYTDNEGNEEDIPLGNVATFTEAEGLSSINRDAQERYITVSAALEDDYNITQVSAQVQKALDGYELPAGYTLEMTGEDESINDAAQQILLMLVLAIAFIYLIMVAQFQSLLSPFIIMFTIPLAFTGSFFALFFCGFEISIIAMIGFVLLAGIIVNNGIVMVDYINQLRLSGMSKKDAIIEAGQTRLRPIMMTALTTIFGLSTMALGIGMGADLVQPMAIVAIGGLIYGTLLTLIVVPCIYDAFHREKALVDRLEDMEGDESL